MDNKSAPHQEPGLTMDRPQQSDGNGTESPGHQVNQNMRPREEAELEESKLDYEVRVTPEFLQKFNEENHAGRIPPDPSVLPAKFLCIHCNMIVGRKKDASPFDC
ncbi:hypothetical protein F4824DRAFT_506818 [Ustulina deusta]|nr:hypothetical protein F4824DRAFT_506818 [Ustulina deusta]